DVYNSYAGAFFSYPFTIPKVYGAGISLHLFRNPRTWGFCTNTPIDFDGYYIRLCDNYGLDPDTHADIGTPGTYENYIELWGGRAFYTGTANKPGNWQHATKVRNWAKSFTNDTYSESSIDGDLTAPLNFTISKFEGDTIFLEFGVWGTENNYRSGFFQLDDVRFNYTDFSTSINELQYINSTATIITRDVDGRIVPNAEVMLIDATVPKGNPGYEIARGFSDSTGRITFSNLANRKYNITANYTLGSREAEVYNSFTSGNGPFYFNGISYTENIYLDLWTIDFEISDWDGIPLSKGYIEVNESLYGDLLNTLTLDTNGRATFRWLNVSSYYFRVYYDNDDYYGNPLLLNESYIYRSDYDKSGIKYQEYSISVYDSNINSPGTNSYSLNEYIYTNGSRTDFGYEKIIKIDISLTSMIDQLEDISIYYIDKYNTTGTSNHLIYFEDGYGPGEDNDFIELDIPLIENSKLASEKYEVHGLLIEVNGLNFSQCNGLIEIDTIETCNIYNRTHLARINIKTVDEYDNPISSEIHIKLSDNALIDLTSSSSTTGGWAYDSNDLPFWYLKDRTYNFTIDAYNLTTAQFDVNYIDPPQSQPSGVYWFNFTLERRSTINFTVYLPGVNTSRFLTSFSNSSGTEEAYWGDNITFSTIFEYTDDDGQTWYPITDPSARCILYVRRVGTTTDLIRVFMEHGTGNGNFTINIDSTLLSAGGSSRFYNVRIEGLYPGFPAPNIISFLLEIKSIPTNIGAYDYDTQLEVLDKVYMDYFDESVNIMIKYSINESGVPLQEAILTYEWLGHDPIRIYIDPIYTDFYKFTLDTEDALTTGLKVITITASYENYTTKSNFLVYLNILERETTINDQSTDLYYVSSWVYVQTQKNFIFTYRDASTNNIVGDLIIFNYVWEELYENGTKIPGSFGSGSLTQNLNQTYMLDFNTELKSIGYYFLYVTLKQDNYEQKNAFIYLEIRLRNFFVTIQEPHLGASNQILINQGSDLDFEIHLWDDTRDAPLQNANIEFNFRGLTYTFDPIPTNPGAYNKSILTRDINTFIMAQTFVGKISIKAANFTSQEFTITITVKMQELWTGMPTFYFILIASAVGGVVGSVVGYRLIQQARIPKYVKKIRKVKGLIKSKKRMAESFSVPSKNQMMVKLFGDDWKEIGLSIEEALGITDLKKKSSLNDKITKERGDIE
ncbi:MAG: hypothetical protein ACFFCY_18230, partial [Promethearchaeota archaeon]